MSVKDPNDLSEFSMVELFRLEVENQSIVFTENVLALEQDPEGCIKARSPDARGAFAKRRREDG